jgi:hypothetical protein
MTQQSIKNHIFKHHQTIFHMFSENTKKHEWVDTASCPVTSLASKLRTLSPHLNLPHRYSSPTSLLCVSPVKSN